jgi:hypothetical protein
MKSRYIVTIVLSVIFASAALEAQTVNSGWVGVWHANAGGLPASTLTLANDTGQLGGTFVLDMIGDEGGPHIIASEPHVLLNPLVAGGTLTFNVKTHRPDGLNAVLSFEVKPTGADKATIHCTNCGAGAPVVELVRGL